MRKSDYRTTRQAVSRICRDPWLRRLRIVGQAFSIPPPPATPPVPKEVTLLYQGAQWDQANRAAFYTQDQGSRIMPLAWFKALRLSDNTGFTADGLARFGYL